MTDLELERGTVIAGRYELIELIGSTATSTVYLVKDRSLERVVALELHRSRTEQLRRDALAMAKVAHPNVVAVFEVGEHEGRAFVAMEYVAGSTMRDWLSARDRSSHEILDVLLAGGEAIAAAHDAKLVHRGFTLDEVLVGRDGRVRVGNFRFPEDGHDEQTDQRAFCADATLATKSRAIRRVLARALADDSDARYPSMRALLAALRDTRRRHRIVISGIGLALVGSTAAIAWPSSTGANVTCEGAGVEILTVGLDVPARIAAGSGPTAGAMAAKRLAAYRQSFVDIAAKVCRNGADRMWSPELYERGLICLDVARRLRIAMFDDREHVTSADLIDRVLRTYDETSCADAVGLAITQPYPKDPDSLEATIRARVVLASATSKYATDGLKNIQEALTEVRASPVRDLPAVALRVDFLAGGELALRGKREEARALFEKTYHVARGLDDADMALISVSQLILTTQGDALKRWLLNGIADAERMSQRAPMAAARLYAVAAATSDGFGDPQEALSYLDRAFALFGDTPSRPLGDALLTRASVQITAGKPAAALADYRQALDMLESLYGADHPYMATVKINASMGLSVLGKPQEAAALAKEGEANLAKNPGFVGKDITQLKINLGVSYTIDRDLAKARRYFAEARANVIALDGAVHPDIAIIDASLAYIYAVESKWEDAIKLARETLVLMETVLPTPSEHRGEVLLTLADAANATKDFPTAIRSAELSAGEYAAGDDRKLLSLIVAAMIANDTMQGDVASRLLAKIDALPTSSEAMLRGRIAYERGRAIVNMKGDLTRARSAFDTAIRIFSEANLASWQKEATAARAKLK